ncbi:WD domain-containing protein, G-beta repeat-containing protein [Streptomyces zhaozhouensis]|uniref:WD domain-containing protein, G-beta repeat-containing protein n=1 Tax=Streptomyces zhaozhouensis TaxID=1300267 RepID=A0A286DSJ0_9ACTN|nr:PQQ-binding-like beta-propeller repeat protein [Streptomyces zhaozhouensis]SOD61610.1 WD domain-containing protein, G-beta repeat-containing protein [Streptomyces zhaozhouensis]
MTDERLILSSAVPGNPRIDGLAVVEVDGSPLVVCTGFYTLWCWALLQNDWEERPLAYAFAEDPRAAEYPDAKNDIGSVAMAVFDGRVVVAAGGDEQAAAIWDLDSGELLRAPTDELYVASIATVKGEGPPLFVASSGIHWDGVRVWGLSGEEPPVELDAGSIWGLATASVDGRSLVAGGGEEGVEVWDAATGEQVASFYVDDEERAYAVALSQLDGRPVVVAGTDSGKVYVFDLSGDEDDDPIHEPSTGHEGSINALDATVVGDRAVAVTGGEDGTVRIWDLANGRQVGPPLTGHDWSVEAVVVTTMQDRPVALTAGRDGVVRIWDLTL